MKAEIRACIRKDFLTSVSYLLSFFLTFFDFLPLIAILYFIVKIFGQQSFAFNFGGYNITYFLFIVSGFIIATYLFPALDLFYNLMEEERGMGTLEAIFMTPTKLTIIIISKYIWSLIFTSVVTLPISVLGFFILKIKFTFSMILAMIVILALLLIAFGAIAVILASSVIIFIKSYPIMKIFKNVFRIFGEVYFPIVILPKSLQLFSYFLPITYGIRAFRKILFMGYTLSDIIPDTVVLCVFIIILWPLSFFTIRYSLKRAREKGSLSHY